MGAATETVMVTVTGSNLRRGQLKDLGILAHLEEISFGEDRFNKAQIRHLLTRANADTLVLEFKGRVQGAAVMLWRKKSRLGRLYSIVIDPSFRGQGLGDVLLKACESAALKKGCSQISLEVRSDNKAAIGLYSKFGYRIIEELPGYYAKGKNGVRMVKSLESLPNNSTTST